MPPVCLDHYGEGTGSQLLHMYEVNPRMVVLIYPLGCLYYGRTAPHNPELQCTNLVLL